MASLIYLILGQCFVLEAFFLLQCLPFCFLHTFRSFFLQASLHTTLKHFRKFRTRLQRSKGLQLSACFRIVKVFGLPMGIIVHLQVL